MKISPWGEGWRDPGRTFQRMYEKKNKSVFTGDWEQSRMEGEEDQYLAVTFLL